MTISNFTPQNQISLSFDPSNDSDSSISSDSGSDSDRKETSDRRVLVPVVNPQPERPIRRRLHSYTLFARLESGDIHPFSFTFDRRPNMPSYSFSRESPANPFYPPSGDSRISNSFRTTPKKNVKVLIVRGRYKNQHGVIVKSYVLRKSSHRVLTTDGAVTTLKQIHLRRLDPQFFYHMEYLLREFKSLLDSEQK